MLCLQNHYCHFLPVGACESECSPRSPDTSCGMLAKAWHTCWQPHYLYSILTACFGSYMHTYIFILVLPCLLSFTGISPHNEFSMKKQCFPKGCVTDQTVTHQRFMANSPHWTKSYCSLFIFPEGSKAKQWSLMTVNISKCLTESQFSVFETIFPDGNSEFEIHMWYPKIVNCALRPRL